MLIEKGIPAIHEKLFSKIIQGHMWDVGIKIFKKQLQRMVLIYS